MHIFKTGEQTLEQHCEFLVHEARLCKQDAAWAGVGAAMDVISGNAMAAAMPILCMATRREGDSTGTSLSTSRCASPNWPRASRTICSPTGVENWRESSAAIWRGVRLPSHSRHTAAAVEFRQ